MKYQKLKNGDTYKKGDISYDGKYMFITLSSGDVYFDNEMSSLEFMWGSDFGEDFPYNDDFETFRKIEKR